MIFFSRGSYLGIHRNILYNRWVEWDGRSKPHHGRGDNKAPSGQVGKPTCCTAIWIHSSTAGLVVWQSCVIHQHVHAYNPLISGRSRWIAQRWWHARSFSIISPCALIGLSSPGVPVLLRALKYKLNNQIGHSCQCRILVRISTLRLFFLKNRNIIFF